MGQARRLFPTSGAIPEADQIGRKAVIADLEAYCQGNTSVLLIERRRVGKTSVARAALQRVRTADEATLALQVDLRDGIRSGADMATQLLEQAASQGAVSRMTALLARQRVRRLEPAVMRSVGEIVGVGDDHAKAISRLGEALSSASDLRGVLGALEGHARVVDRRVVLFVDELQELTALPDASEVQRILATAVRRPGSHLSLVLAADPRLDVGRLFGVPGADLHSVGQRFTLPDISSEDWLDGLRRRFAQTGYEISPRQVFQILDETDGHPHDTMSVCSHCFSWLTEEVVTAATVERAIEQHRRHPSREGR